MSIKSSLGRQLGTQFDTVFDVVKSNPVYDRAGGSIPSLDLNFAKNKSLRDSRSTKNKITFTRASSGTYVDGDGLIKTSPVNLLTYSEQFDHTSWSGFRMSVTANALAAPDGTQTANLVASTESSANGSAIFKSFSETTTTYTFSVFAKAGTGSTLLLRPTNNSVFSQRAEAWFDLSGGTAGTVEDDGSVFTNASSQIVSQGDGWFRCSLTFTVASAGFSATARLYVVDSNGGLPVSNGASIYFWGAQLEEGSTATDYIPTTSTISGAPRFDHDPDTGESLGLLIEEARTNLLVYSEQFDNSAWVKANSTTITPNTIASPDGSITAETFNRNSTSTGNYLESTSVSKNATSITYTWSLFVKKNDARYASLRLQGSYPSRADVVFDLDTGTVAVAANSTQNFSNASSSIQALSNSWFRVSLTATSDSVNYIKALFGCSAEANQIDGTSSVANSAYIWGAQLEEGSFVTSYIPTESSTVTRAADVAEISGNKFAKTNLLEYSERFDQSAWVIYRAGSATPNTSLAPDGTNTAYTLSKTTTTDGLLYQLVGTGTYTFSCYAKAGSTQYITLGCTANFQGRHCTFNLNDGTVESTGNYNGALAYITGGTGEAIDVGNGWYRCVFSGITVSGNRAFHVGADLINSTTASNVLVWGAQLEEGDELTKYTPSVESFVSRASSATFVDDATGLITTTPVNLLTHSEELDQWIVGTNSTVTSNASTAPDGTNTADRVQHSTSGGYSWVKNGISVDGGQQYTFSVYAKAVTPGTNDQFAFFYSSTESDTKTATSEWQRFTWTFTATSTQEIYLNNGDDSFATDVYFWGAQLEEGTTATDYIHTTNTISGAARFENNQLILEESRTNFALNSDSAQGSSIGTAIHNSTESVVSPRGITETVRRLGRDFSAGGDQVWRVGSTNGGTPNTTYTISFFAKTVNGGTSTINININDATPTSGQETIITGEWTRIIKTGGNRNNSLRFFDMNMRSDTNEDFYVWGTQIEVGDFVTSYIPTDSTQGGKTRAADVSTSALGVDSFYNQNEGTVFVDAGPSKQSSISAGRPFMFHDGTTDNRIGSNFAFSSTFNLFYSQGGNSPVDLGNITGLPKAVAAAIAYKSGDYRGAYDGNLALSDSTAAVPLVDTLSLGFQGYNSVAYHNGHIKRLAYFPTRLPDDKLKSITS